MSDDEEQELLRLESRVIDVLTDMARYRIRMSRKCPRVAADSPTDLPQDLIELGIAAGIAKRPSDTVRSWCRLHLIDEGGNGFAMKLQGRWFVSRKSFVDFLRNDC